MLTGDRAEIQIRPYVRGAPEGSSAVHIRVHTVHTADPSRVSPGTRDSDPRVPRDPIMALLFRDCSLLKGGSAPVAGKINNQPDV